MMSGKAIIIALGIQHIHYVVACGLPGCTIFFHSTSKMAWSYKKSYWKQNVCFDFLYNFCVWNISHSKKNWARYDKKRVLVFISSTS
jgi:hypothetical protein